METATAKALDYKDALALVQAAFEALNSHPDIQIKDDQRAAPLPYFKGEGPAGHFFIGARSLDEGSNGPMRITVTLNGDEQASVSNPRADLGATAKALVLA